MPSFKLTLKFHIINKYPSALTLNEVHAIARSLNHKESNAERRLRELCADDNKFTTIKNHKGIIVGYKWIKI